MDGDDAGGHSRRRFLLGAGTAGSLALAGCTENPRDPDGGAGGTNQPATLEGDIVVKGSSTVFPVSDAVAERFMDEHTGVNVTVDSTGTGGGFENWFCAGDADLNGASRPITDAEREQCSASDVAPVEFEVAGDAVTVAVNNDNDWVDCVSFPELSRIWRESGAGTWADVREGWPDRPINLFGPAPTSGTFDWFREHVVGPDRRHTSDHQPTEEDEQIVQGIQDNVGAMGYFGFAYYSANSDLVRALSVRTEGGSCTPANLPNATDGSYPLSRPLFLYAAESALEREAVAEFLRFYLEAAETDLVSEIGYVPSSADQREENLATLAEVRDG